jgi:hypothetical protein
VHRDGSFEAALEQVLSRRMAPRQAVEALVSERES